MPTKFAKVHKPVLPPKTSSGRTKQRKRIEEAGDYEGTLWNRIEWYRGIPIEAVAQKPDAMNERVRYFVRKHHHLVTAAMDAVVTKEASDLRTEREGTLLVRGLYIGFRGASKLPSVRLIEKIRRAPPSWWTGLDPWKEHIAVLAQAGHEVLVEWLRTYKP